MAVANLSPDTSPLPDLGFGRAFSRFNWPTGGAGRRPAAAELSPAEQQTVRELQAIDRRVRAHELAHLNAGDGVVQGGPSYSYTQGPDGRRYAVGGEVPIDTAPGRTPEETLARAEAIRRAALAPADPSAQDRRVAAIAARMAADAAVELALKRQTAGSGAASGNDRLDLYRQVEGDGAPAAAGLRAVA